MKLLDKLIRRHVVLGSLMALAVLVSIDLAVALAAEAPEIGTGNYDFGKSLLYAALTAPRRAYDFMPMAAIVGSLMFLGAMAENSEFIVMRSAGVSIGRIAYAITKGGLVLIVIALILGEGITPFSEPYAQQMRTFALSQSTALKSDHGIWARDGNSFINVLQVRPGGELRKLTIYEFDDDMRLHVIARAESAQFTDNIWELRDIHHVRISDEKTEVNRYKKANWEALINPELLSVLAVKPWQLPTWRLTTYIDYLERNGLESEPYKFAFWHKIVSPFAILIMLFLSVPFIFSNNRAVGSGQRILIGIVLGIGYYLLSQITSNMGETYNLDPMLSNVVPNLLFLAAGFVGLRMVR